MLRYAVEMFTYTKIHHWKKISCYFSKYHPMHIHNLLNNFSKMLIEFFHEKIPEIYCQGMIIQNFILEDLKKKLPIP